MRGGQVGGLVRIGLLKLIEVVMDVKDDEYDQLLACISWLNMV